MRRYLVLFTASPAVRMVHNRCQAWQWMPLETCMARNISAVTPGIQPRMENDCYPNGCGMVFRLTKNGSTGTYTSLYGSVGWGGR